MADPATIKALFSAALDQPESQRGAYLDSACGGDVALRREVEDLLAVMTGRPVLDAWTLPVDAPRPATTTLAEGPGTCISHYKLLEKIGEGGFGTVFMAEQEQPVRRRVALKIIKLGMDTLQVIARFEAERQALAMMDHPHIARVLDAGATQTGRPFFVMELVRGDPITSYCDRHNLATRQRLELFAQVCHAVQHAHQKGIIHRDIKPSNILVTVTDGKPVPKVIDFGVAKATNARLTEKTLFTEHRQLIGTPAYMSPEQAVMSGPDIDTRSDIYSLGVLLYELLTGTTPFDARELLQAGYGEIQRVIREVEPEKPSTRLSSLRGTLAGVAARRDTEPRKLGAIIRGDLDWIAMKCLEKDRARRYETADGLALDVQRHLAGEPVVAAPPSTAYRLRKFVRRNKGAVLAGGLMTATLILGATGTSLALVQAERHRRSEQAAKGLAQKNYDEARAALRELLILADEDLNDISGMQPLRFKLMHSALERYKSFLEQPSEDPAPRAELARLYLMYGFASRETSSGVAGAEMAAYRQALAIQDQLLREHPGDRGLRSDHGWTSLLMAWRSSMSPAENEQACNQAIATFEQLVEESPADPLARSDLTLALWLLSGRPYCPNAVDTAQRALAVREQLVREFPRSAECRRNLANSLQRCASLIAAGNLDDALALMARATQLRKDVLADLRNGVPEARLPLRPRDSAAYLQKVTVIWTTRDVAYGFLKSAEWCLGRRRPGEALAFADQAVNIMRDVVQLNPNMIKFVNELDEAVSISCQTAQDMGDVPGAQARLGEAVHFWQRLVQANPGNEQLAQKLAVMLLQSGDPAAVSRRLQELREALPADSAEMAFELAGLAHGLLAAGLYTQAEAVARESLDIRERRMPDSFLTCNARSLLGGSLLGQGRFAEAETLLLASYECMLERTLSNPADCIFCVEDTLKRILALYESWEAIRPPRGRDAAGRGDGPGEILPPPAPIAWSRR
jgi:serine/threonine protein kinase/tetratricopeptide (TPR) repeat protein